jgi:hypothetical protein
MRPFCALIVLCACTALAQEAVPEEPPPVQPERSRGAAAPPEPKPLETTVTAKPVSPPRTQDRVFASTRFWRLDPGEYEVEVWVSDKFKRDHSDEGLLQLEVEIGLAPHLQLDLYQNFTFGSGGFGLEGNQLELRIAFGSEYDSVPLNPVLYLEWHPRKDAQHRAEARLLLGGDLGSRFIWAANVFFESNVDDIDKPGSEGADMEIGATAAGSFAVVSDVFRVGAEVKLGVDQHGGPTFEPMLLVGPNILLTSRALKLKLTATLLIGVMEKDPRLQPFIIAGWQF